MRKQCGVCGLGYMNPGETDKHKIEHEMWTKAATHYHIYPVIDRTIQEQDKFMSRQELINPQQSIEIKLKAAIAILEVHLASTIRWGGICDNPVTLKKFLEKYDTAPRWMIENVDDYAFEFPDILPLVRRQIIRLLNKKTYVTTFEWWNTQKGG
jgi:hypothetical protein